MNEDVRSSKSITEENPRFLFIKKKYDEQFRHEVSDVDYPIEYLDEIPNAYESNIVKQNRKNKLLKMIYERHPVVNVQWLQNNLQLILDYAVHLCLQALIEQYHR